MKPMPMVEQKTKTDCGVACLAMLCDVTYEEAYRAIPWRKHGCMYGTDTKQLREGAKRLGFEGYGTPKGQLRRITSVVEWWTDLPDNSLVKIPHPREAGSWHWVVWRKGKVYDPARKGAFKPDKYITPPGAYMQFQPRLVHSIENKLGDYIDD